MGVFIQYPAVNARIRAITGKMLKEEHYNDLLEITTVQGISDYLYRNTYYHQHLEELSGREVHRRQLEFVLKKSFIADYQTISRYLRANSKDFFQYLFRKFEIEDLKMLLRTILIEHDEEYLQESLVYLGVSSEFDLQKLTEIKSYKDIMKIFQDTEYFPVLRRFADKYEEERNLFPVEMSLDLHYFSRLEELGRKTGAGDYKYIEELLGTQVDLLNIQWIYRIKKYYHLSSGEILNYIIPFEYKLTRDDFRKMSEVKKPADISRFISYQGYSDLLERAFSSKTGIFEKYFLTYLMKKALRIKSLSFLNIGNIIAYLFLKEYEIRDIISIVEGVRYSLNKEKIKEYLIRDGV